MELSSFITDDDAVSPVIGVILMVAITVILAAVVAGFLFSVIDTENNIPQVSFDYDYDAESTAGAGDGNLTIIVTGGQTFTADQVRFAGTNLGTGTDGNPNAGREWHERATGSSVGQESIIGGGQRAKLTGLSDDFELELVWGAEDGEQSSILSTRTGPDA